MTATTVSTVYAVFATLDQADRIGRTVVEERLAACVNILAPVRSFYRWQGEVRRADEVAAIIKTSRDKADALIDRIIEMHSYDVPCVVTWPVDKVPESYARWVAESVG